MTSLLIRLLVKFQGYWVFVIIKGFASSWAEFLYLGLYLNDYVPFLSIDPQE